MASKFKYTPSDPKSLKERSERTGGGFDTYFKPGIDIYKNKVGENCVRILPPTFKKAKHFGYDIWVHGFVGPDKSSFLCPKKMLGKKCVVCDAATEALEAGEKEESDQIKAKQKIIYWVIDRDGDSGEPEVWPVSWTMDKDISGRCVSKRTGKVLYIDDPDKGHDVTFRRTGTGFKTRYDAVTVEGEKTPIAESQKRQDRVLEYIEEHPLDEILKYHKTEQMLAALAGGAAEKDEDLDEDEDEGNKKRRRRGRDDDNEEDDEPKSRARRNRSSDDEDEEEEPHTKRRNRSSSTDDDEDDETPRRGRSRGDDDDEDDGRKKKRRPRDDADEENEPRRSRKSRDEDERDPADDDEEEDGDDDSRSSKTKKKRRPADGDEDDHDGSSKRRSRTKDDDDEQDDAPRSKKRKSRDDGDEDEEEIPSSRRAKRNRD